MSDTNAGIRRGGVCGGMKQKKNVVEGGNVRLSDIPIISSDR